MWAKQNNRIIDSLEMTSKKDQKEIAAKPLKNWKHELDKLAGQAKKLRGSVGHPAIYSPAFSLVKASIEFAQLAVSDSDDLENLYKAFKKVNRTPCLIEKNIDCRFLLVFNLYYEIIV